jgi:hypothetical protein
MFEMLDEPNQTAVCTIKFEESETGRMMHADIPLDSPKVTLN